MGAVQPEINLLRLETFPHTKLHSGCKRPDTNFSIPEFYLSMMDLLADKVLDLEPIPEQSRSRLDAVSCG